jgi:hypothetical protein
MVPAKRWPATGIFSFGARYNLIQRTAILRPALAKLCPGGYDAVMSEGLSKQEIFGWLVCLTLALGFTVFGSAYLITSFLSADVSGSEKSGKPVRNGN